MSKHRDLVFIDAPPDQAEPIVRQAIAELGWRILEDEGNRLVVKEVTPHGLSFTGAAKIEVLISDDEGDTEVALRGSIMGIGPVQAGHLRGQVGNLKNRISVAANASQSAGAIGSSSELERLAGLHRSGVLTDDEFAQAKARLLEG